MLGEGMCVELALVAWWEVCGVGGSADVRGGDVCRASLGCLVVSVRCWWIS